MCLLILGKLAYFNKNQVLSFGTYFKTKLNEIIKIESDNFVVNFLENIMKKKLIEFF